MLKIFSRSLTATVRHSLFEDVTVSINKSGSGDYLRFSFSPKAFAQFCCAEEAYMAAAYDSAEPDHIYFVPVNRRTGYSIRRNKASKTNLNPRYYFTTPRKSMEGISGLEDFLGDKMLRYDHSNKLYYIDRNDLW